MRMRLFRITLFRLVIILISLEISFIVMLRRVRIHRYVIFFVFGLCAMRGIFYFHSVGIADR